MTEEELREQIMVIVGDNWYGHRCADKIMLVFMTCGELVRERKRLD